MDVILIAAITMDGYIARHHHEVIDWSEDLRLFKEQTLGYPVIMGSNTSGCLQTVLIGREIIVVHRNDNTKAILDEIKSEKCFIAGGGKTNFRFAPHLTHLYLTTHPFIFGKGIPLFDGKIKELKLELENVNPIVKEKGVYQFQYRADLNLAAK